MTCSEEDKVVKITHRSGKEAIVDPAKVPITRECMVNASHSDVDAETVYGDMPGMPIEIFFWKLI